jgi:hypothetical protein
MNTKNYISDIWKIVNFKDGLLLATFSNADEDNYSTVLFDKDSTIIFSEHSDKDSAITEHKNFFKNIRKKVDSARYWRDFNPFPSDVPEPL